MLIPSALLVVGLLCSITFIFLHAKSRIATEVTSSVQLAQGLATTALRNVAGADSAAVAFAVLARDLPQVRHVRFSLEAFGDTPLPAAPAQIGGGRSPHLPLLASLLVPPPVEQRFPVDVRGTIVGSLIVHSDPGDELGEIITEVEMFSVVLLGLCLLTVGGLLATVRRSLSSLRLVTEGFDRLERGDYRPIGDIPVSELARVSRQFNAFAKSLRRVTADNRLLIDRLFSMQDRERKEIAAELHDEFGPALFAVRAEAACIMRTSARDGDAFAHARSIADLTEAIQRVNYRMLERLRPLVLEQVGVVEALQQLVASWQARCPHVTWSVDLPPDFNDPDEAGR